MPTAVIPSGDRMLWPGSDVVSRQSFPATGSTRMTDYAFGLLLIHNDDVVQPGQGFDMHHHADVEIVSWIVHGHLRHRDSTGAETVLGPGHAEAITAGRGVWHAETNAAGFTSTETLRVVQMWLPTDDLDVDPSHAVADLNGDLAGGQLVTVASGYPGDDAPLTIRTSGARLRAVRLAPGEGVTTGAAAYLHVYVVSGDVTVHTRDGMYHLAEGDAARVTGGEAGPSRLTGNSPSAGRLSISCEAGAECGPAEVLVWEMDHSVRTTPRS